MVDLLQSMPQRSARLSILPGPVGRYYDALEDVVEYAGQGHARHQGIPQTALNKV
jgi:hypothetical protein